MHLNSFSDEIWHFRFVKVFIQQVQTRKLLTESLGWGDGEENAKDFITSVEAIEWVLANKIRAAQILIRMEWENAPPLSTIFK